MGLTGTFQRHQVRRPAKSAEMRPVWLKLGQEPELSTVVDASRRALTAGERLNQHQLPSRML